MLTLKTDAERRILVESISGVLENVYFDFTSGGGYDIITPPTEIRIYMDYSEYDEYGVDINEDQSSKELVLLFSQKEGFRLFFGDLFNSVDNMDKLYPKKEGVRYIQRHFIHDIFSKAFSQIVMETKPTYVSISRE